MARKQAKRRKPKKVKQWSMPSIRLSLIVGPLAAVGVVVATYYLSSSMLDREIRSIEISEPGLRITRLSVSALSGRPSGETRRSD